MLYYRTAVMRADIYNSINDEVLTEMILKYVEHVYVRTQLAYADL